MAKFIKLTKPLKTKPGIAVWVNTSLVQSFGPLLPEGSYISFDKASENGFARVEETPKQILAPINGEGKPNDAIDLLRWLDQRGGLGLDAHDRIRGVLERAAPKPAA